MLHAHGIAGFFCTGYAVDAFGDLQAADLDGVNAERRVDGYGPTHTDRDTVGLAAILEGEHLAEAAHIQPGLAGNFCVNIGVFFFFQCRDGVSTVFQAFAAVDAAVIGLHKNRSAEVHHAVADLPFQADI